MKKVVLVTFLIITSAQFTFSQNAIAKLKFEDAEDAFANNDFELTLSKLKDVETILKSTNPKILYLQILSQGKIIEKNPLNNFHIIEDARKSCQKYLIDYENLPDNRDKYRDVYKVSESLKKWPDSVEEFRVKADENFAAFTFFHGYKSGLTLEQAKLEFPTFFKRTNKQALGPNLEIYVNIDDGVSSLSVKNGILAGNGGLLESFSDDANFTIGLKKISDIVNDLTSRFNLNPTKAINNVDQSGVKYDATTFTWTKNGKSIIITYKQTYSPNGFWSASSYNQFDKCYFE